MTRPLPHIGKRNRAVEIDTWIDRDILKIEALDDALDPKKRVLRDAVHFSVSLLSELRCALSAAPGFVAEIARTGLYPDHITFRKLPYHPERSNLKLLKAKNPEWVFREDFDPRRWVIVFLHGYIDNTGADRVAFKLAQLGYQVYLVRYPFLRNVRRIAGELAEVLELIGKRERGKRLLPIGHSLGGFVWDHLLLHRHDIAERYSMPLYIPMGSPHFGTLAAYLGVGQSARQMRPTSDVVLEHLHRDFPPGLEIYPFVSRFDLLVLPIETALLKRGVNYVFNETGHIGQVIRNETVQAIEEIMASPPELLRARAEKRSFHLSTLTNMLRNLPEGLRRRAGLDGVLRYVGATNGPSEFLLRVVHHELRMGLFPTLLR